MFLLIVMCVLIAALEWFSFLYATKGLGYDLVFSKCLAEPDEIVVVTTIIENNSVLPKTYIRLSEVIPNALICDEAGGAIESDDGDDASKRVNAKNSGGFNTRIEVSRDSARISTTLYVMPYQRATKELHVRFKERGCYKFFGATMLCGDFIGIKTKQCSFPLKKEITVAPRRCEDIELKRVLGGMLGNMSVRRFIFEDPVLTVGVREYTGTEPMKSISWALSARSSDTMVKVYDYTLEPTAAVALSVECDLSIGNINVAECLERAFSVSRTVCETLDNGGIKYSFFTNARIAGGERIWPTAKDGFGPTHLNAILEGLGRANYFPSESACEMLLKVIRSAEAGRSHILILPEVTEKEKPYIDRLKLITGSEVMIIETLVRKGTGGRFVWKW